MGAWLFMPKCPVCFAAHMGLWTGLGLSYSVAASVRWWTLSVAGGLLFILVVKRSTRFVRNRIQ